MLIRKTLQLGTLIGAIFATGYLLADDHEGGGNRSLPIVSNQKWQAECASCHMLYHPGLLPERSWRKLMGGLDKHFGENASLDKATQQEILQFLATNSADHSGSRRSAKIASSIPAKSVPIRVTETAYFQGKHDEISPATWKSQKIGSQSNCIACHSGAEKGNFSEDNVRIPR
ncbi:diheme cytochrome c [Sulfurirhabdus autotrophica]|uniref:Diheme cytochrome c n=1 Tax=Sulfurirhabdus autotrophica TaxID=1706046 RepID=A0A4R3YEK5_9PROT|nr:diheme cytochrome c [Sulfurirhabdus autotrophica]TCV90312.1 diheme cytochrome c [Sulfurirhabdus autotrophica]